MDGFCVGAPLMPLGQEREHGVSFLGVVLELCFVPPVSEQRREEQVHHDHAHKVDRVFAPGGC